MNANDPDDHDSELRIPLVEEVATVQTRDRLTGRVRVSTVTDESVVDVEQELQRNIVDVERVPVGRWIADDEPFPSVRTDGNLTILPVVEEVLVVQRRFRLVEEVRITNREATETTHTPIRLRKQRVVVERAGPDGVFQSQPPDSED